MSKPKKDNSYLLPGLLASGLLVTGLLSLITAVGCIISTVGTEDTSTDTIGAGLALIAAAICFTGGLRAVIEFTKD